MDLKGCFFQVENGFSYPSSSSRRETECPPLGCDGSYETKVLKYCLPKAESPKMVFEVPLDGKPEPVEGNQYPVSGNPNQVPVVGNQKLGNPSQRQVPVEGNPGPTEGMPRKVPVEGDQELGNPSQVKGRSVGTHPGAPKKRLS